MNNVRRCLVVALFVLAAQPVFAAPGAAVLVAPSGEVAMGTPITFSWQAVPESTWYLFWLGKGTPTAYVMQQWYGAEQAGCASGGGTCTITLTAPVNAGSHTWFVQTWAAGVTGPWSPGLQFVVSAPHWSSRLPDNRRFTLVLNDEAVLDNETGLVWQRTPSTFTYQFLGIRSICTIARTGGRLGWRVPMLTELRSVADFNQMNPSLPAGHPFTIANDRYWTFTDSNQATYHYTVHFSDTSYLPWPDHPDYQARVWCVRGGSADGQ